MSFADPQSITIGGTTTSLPKTGGSGASSEYASGDRTIILTASSQYGKRTRQVARVNFSKISADLFLPDTNVERSMSCYVVVDRPAVGFSNAEALDVYKGLTGQLNASTYAVITKLLGGES